ncbi:MAG: pyruvate, phosphate dikinase, partial [Candidatus Nanopelagicales bacterium]
GMMDTVLNIGLNDETIVALAEDSGDERFAWDSYRRLIQMFGKTVLDIEGEKFEEVFDAHKEKRGAKSDLDLNAQDLQEVVKDFKEIVLSETGEEFPQGAYTQLDLAIRAVFNSWNTERAKIYRRQERIPDDLGTAVNVGTMVFGNKGSKSGTGVAFTRDPATGAPGAYGDWLTDAQGEDVVAGIRNTLHLDDLAELMPEVHKELMQIMQTLETHYKDLCDIEFTVEDGKLWMLQTRIGKRTAAAAFRIASQLVDEELITLDEALQRVSGVQLQQLMFPRFDVKAEKKLIAKGIAASPGASVGKVVFSSKVAVEQAASGSKVILVRRETNPDDLAGMVAATGILTSRGGKTSHAAVVARGMGKTAVCGAESLLVDTEAKSITLENGEVLNEGELISIDGTSGEVFLGDVPVAPSLVSRYFEEGLAAVEQDELIKAVDRLVKHADKTAKLKVRANADTKEDAIRARKMGAEGIGLARTEHMFLGERKKLVETLILAESNEEREVVYEKLLPLQTQDFYELLEATDGYPVVIRLIDPPLHEFLPEHAALAVEVALAKASGKEDKEKEKLLAAVEANREQNPMLGMRGVRLGLQMPGLFATQVKAIAQATAKLLSEGKHPHPEIMVPLVATVAEFTPIKKEASEIFEKTMKENNQEFDPIIGTMIELPRAALTAERIAEEADFFSFGTNDLTQTTWGFSRDDVESEFVGAYLERGILGTSPFESIDTFGVGELVKMAVKKGRATKPVMLMGVCGEHGGDPLSIHFFAEIGLDYVSCSPFRVPIARLEVGRAAINTVKGSDSR